MEEYELSQEHHRKEDRLGGILWALILIWAGVVFLASNLGWLNFGLSRLDLLPGMEAARRIFEAWPLVLLGAGVILLVGVLLRLTVPAFRQPVMGMLIVAVVLISVALDDLLKWNLIWPVLLILIGLSLIFRRR